MNKLLITLLFSILSVAGFSQQYHFHYYNVSSGLIHPAIREIKQDKNGYMWFGTQIGVSRYDGYNFENISDPNSTTETAGMVLTNDGNFWIASRTKGISILKKDRELKTFNSTNSIIPDKVKRITRAKQKGLIVLSESNNFYHVESDSQFHSVLGDVKLPEAIFNDILEIDNGYALASNVGLLIVRYGRVQYHFTTKEGLKSNNVAHITYDTSLNLMFANYDGSIYKVINNEIKPFFIPASLNSNSQISLLSASDGSIWLGTDNGLIRIEGDRKEYIGLNNGLPHNSITALFEDREQNIWIGTQNGAVKLSSFAFKSFSSFFSGISLSVQKIINEGKDLWVFSPQGITILDKEAKTWKNVRADFSGKNRVNDILSISSSLKYLATDNGLKEFRNGSIFESVLNRDLPTKAVKSINKDYNNNYYVGTDSGLFVFKNNELVNEYTIENEFPNNVVTSIHITQQNEVLVGTESGFVKLGEGTLLVLKTGNGLVGNHVTTITDDGKGRVWIGTKQGVSSLKNGRFTNYSPKSTFVETEAVEDVVLDDSNVVWCATSKGLYLIKPRNEFAYINSKDGLLSDLVTSLAYDNQKDILYVGTNSGLTQIELKYLKTISFRPQITFIQFSTNLKSHSLNELVLSDLENEINIIVSLLSFIDEKRIVFRYRLIGIDEVWNYLINSNKIKLKDLAPGSYTLEVQASLDGLNWLPQIATLNFTIKSQLFSKWYFYAVIILLLLAALFLTRFLYKNRRLRFRWRKVSTSQEVVESEKNAESQKPDIEKIVKYEHDKAFFEEKLKEKSELFKSLLMEKEDEIKKLKQE
ncbi:MAG: hypothetical protein N3A61_01580, partial [Ignavibacteria bacterium]|nr:hypothetical protein [Ignavibacteria bacterium]